MITTNLTGSDFILPSTIAKKHYKIAYYVSNDGGKTWQTGGSSENLFYVVAAAGLTRDQSFETVLNIGCTNANGMIPGNQDVVSQIWKNSFANREIKEVNGTLMHYWGLYAKSNKVFTVPDLLAHADGRM